MSKGRVLAKGTKGPVCFAHHSLRDIAKTSLKDSVASRGLASGPTGPGHFVTPYGT
jgi:hypothetical protein